MRYPVGGIISLGRRQESVLEGYDVTVVLVDVNNFVAAF